MVETNETIGDETFIKNYFVDTIYKPHQRKPFEIKVPRLIQETRSDIFDGRHEPMYVHRMLYQNNLRK